jgi:hypothetical protein
MRQEKAPHSRGFFISGDTTLRRSSVRANSFAKGNAVALTDTAGQAFGLLGD